MPFYKGTLVFFMKWSVESGGIRATLEKMDVPLQVVLLKQSNGCRTTSGAELLNQIKHRTLSGTP